MNILVTHKEKLPSLDILDEHYEDWFPLTATVGIGFVRDMYKYIYCTTTNKGSWKWLCHIKEEFQ